MNKNLNPPNHLRALLKINFILQKRNFCGTCCEIFLPIFFILAFSFLKRAFKNNNYE